jgi:hypothetical protein
MAEITLGIEQHRGRDDRRHLLDAKLLQRRVRGRFQVRLLAAAVILCRVGREFALAVPYLWQHREVADRIHLRALRPRFAAHSLLAVEGVPRTSDADGRPISFP